MDSSTIIIIALLFSAFFSGCEMAFISSNKLLIELNKKKYPRLGKIIDTFINNGSLFISTLLIGNNIALVVYGLEMGRILTPIIENYVSSSSSILFIQTTLSTILILVTAEFLPKILFRINPILVLNITALPLLLFYTIFYPISNLTVFLSEFLMSKILKTPEKKNTKKIVLGRIDLDNLISLHHEKLEDNDDNAKEVKLLKNALDFSKVKVRECIIPRTEISAIEVNENLEILTKRFIETGYSKILIYKKSIDNIIGYIHVSELFKKPKQLKNAINSLSIVPETMTANKLLEVFIKEHRSIALVVDEFGGTAGIVTMEDILEEIFGEIDDEHDVSDLIEKKIADNEYIFSGRVEIDYINEKYNLDIRESENYETLAGFILQHNESIPKNDEELFIDNFKLKIKLASDNRIELVNLIDLGHS
ncbi:hemolysin family protein [Plebeiibacterium sediminum]|uniref:Hemolysin family protein n=1 Tax=Plebeiibacterium sediminum TaxID=2992112 RepID=A0AAE3M7S6_9BACT|nr:hemolysin family protein [Plebeiobacterium sediminum]MCW3788390.1 hemolysin family protein [Plebeiobacterium sediminum]